MPNLLDDKVRITPFFRTWSIIDITFAVLLNTLSKANLNTRFPLEIYDLIIDETAGDIRTLRNCVLVCRAWTQRSRSRLFEYLKFSEYKKSCERFKTAMCGPKSIVPPHVRSLGLRFPAETDKPTGDWVEKLRDLDNIHTISVYDMNWTNLTPKAKARLSRLI